MKSVSCTPCLQECGRRSPSSHYNPINLYNVISKHLEVIIKQIVFSHLSKNNLLATNSMDLVDLGPLLMTAVIKHGFGEVLDNKHITRAITLDISNVFDKVWHKALLHKLWHFWWSLLDY